MSKMYLMTGCSGSGKTTFSKKFAEENNLTYMCVDEYYEKVNGDDTIRKNTFDVWQMFFKDIHDAETAGKDIIVDVNALTIVDRVQMLDWFPRFEPILIRIIAPFKLCVKNNNSRRRKVPYDRLKEMYYKNTEPVYPKELKRWSHYYIIVNKNNTKLKTWRIK